MMRKWMSTVVLMSIAGSAWGQEESLVNDSGYHCGDSQFGADGWWDADGYAKGYLGGARAGAGQSILALGGDVIPAWGASYLLHDQLSGELTKGYYSVWMGPEGKVFPRHFDPFVVKGSFSRTTEFHDEIAQVGMNPTIRSVTVGVWFHIQSTVYSRVNGFFAPDRVALDVRDLWGETVGILEFICRDPLIPKATGDLRYGLIDAGGRITILGGQGYGGYGLPKGSFSAGVCNVRLQFALPTNDGLNETWIDDSVPAQSFVIWREQ